MLVRKPWAWERAVREDNQASLLRRADTYRWEEARRWREHPGWPKGPRLHWHVHPRHPWRRTRTKMTKSETPAGTAIHKNRREAAARVCPEGPSLSPTMSSTCWSSSLSVAGTRGFRVGLARPYRHELLNEHHVDKHCHKTPCSPLSWVSDNGSGKAIVPPLGIS